MCYSLWYNAPTMLPATGLLYMCSVEDITKMYVKDTKRDDVERVLLASVGTSACLFSTE